jgi:hypothetical protein
MYFLLVTISRVIGVVKLDDKYMIRYFNAFPGIFDETLSEQQSLLSTRHVQIVIEPARRELPAAS